MAEQAIVVVLSQKELEGLPATERDKANWVYVTLPSENIFDEKFPTVGINRMNFKAGERYFVPPTIAKEIETIVARRQREDIRILRPDKNRTALREATGSGENARGAELW